MQYINVMHINNTLNLLNLKEQVCLGEKLVSGGPLYMLSEREKKLSRKRIIKI